MGMYDRSCSCCGDYITAEWKKELIAMGDYDNEGNLCPQCHNELLDREKVQMDEAISKVREAFSSDTKREVFDSRSREWQEQFVHNCIAKGYLQFKIVSNSKELNV